MLGDETLIEPLEAASDPFEKESAGLRVERRGVAPGISHLPILQTFGAKPEDGPSIARLATSLMILCANGIDCKLFTWCSC